MWKWLVRTFCLLCLLAVLMGLGSFRLAGIRHQNRQSRQQQQQRRSNWSFIIRQLQRVLPAECSGGRPCISVATSCFGQWEFASRQTWMHSHCSKPCDMTSDLLAADAVVFHGRNLSPEILRLPRRSKQVRVYYSTESPLATTAGGYNVAADTRFRLLFNWTATDMRSSSVPLPLGNWQRRVRPLAHNATFYSAAQKRHLAYAIVSNCAAFNGRMRKIKELQKYMEVHVYGRCGDRNLSFSGDAWIQVSRKYRFYLAFENAFCKDCLTEKLHSNGLKAQAVPVSIGGLSREEADSVAPPHSFVYGPDFSSMRQLASFLEELAKDERRYGGYFQWKRFYRAVEEFRLCRVCLRLHQRPAAKEVVDLKNFYDDTNCRQPNYKYLL